ncbi:hypothetical protein EWM64_g6889 [Hericium alpestre]|uniref:separase n=1 Tax=Hericium alpestre TaxID=135208 RepID=A0A4Y9ZS72_9AGAM|nr:hypothetical protein EWM64_g6889 [Hericium alpestre]
MHGLEWRIADGLLTTLFGLAHNYASRGSVREAEYFAEQAHELAVSLNAPIMICRALAKTGELQLQLGELEKGHEALLKAAESLKDVPGPDAADIRRLHAEYSRLNAKDSDALQLYSEAAYILEELNKMFSTMDGFGIRRSTILSKDAPSKADALVPQLVSSVLRKHIWLLRDDVGKEYQLLLDKFLALPASLETKAEEHTLLAKLTLHDAYDCFREDMFLNSLTESTIALPLGMSVSKSLLASSSVQGIMETLTDAEKLFWSTLSATARRGRVSQLKEVANSLALIQAYTTSLGGSLSEAPVLVSNLLALTLRRELLEVIQGKFPLSQTADDLRWPSVTSNGSPIAPVREQRKRRFESRGSSDDEDDEPVDDDTWLQDYWTSVEKKCRLQNVDPDSLIHSKVDDLPENWTVVNISVTDDKSSMFITRQRAHHAPVVFCLPLKGRRESDGDEHLAYSDAVEELKEIIRLNDEGTKQAIHVKNGDKEARAAWWADRTTLDKRLQDLLENMEFCWLGAFKTTLSPPANVSSDAIADLHSRLEKVFKRGLVSQDKKQRPRTRLDDTLVECFSMLSPKCRDEELEDLIYFIFDLYQFHGVQVAIAEVDIDQLVVDLRTALEEHAAATKAKSQKTLQEDSHMFLILDKNVQAFPWESIPILRGQSVSRIPSVDFLLDRLELVKCKRKRKGRQSPESDAARPMDRLDLNPKSAYYVLNPSGDLGGTETRFASWLTGMNAVGWEGVIGRVPSEQQMLDALSRNDLFIYFGHGGAEQYVRSHKIRHLPKCAATMLWGCSSGLLKDMGDFDRIGTPNNYMLAGCPTLVANLWDVTDRDIDKFSQAVFDEIHLTAEHVGAHAGATGEDVTSVVTAVARAREVCKLKYLTGAAPVIYGIPFYL